MGTLQKKFPEIPSLPAEPTKTLISWTDLADALTWTARSLASVQAENQSIPKLSYLNWPILLENFFPELPSATEASYLSCGVRTDGKKKADVIDLVERVDKEGFVHPNLRGARSSVRESGLEEGKAGDTFLGFVPYRLQYGRRKLTRRGLGDGFLGRASFLSSDKGSR